MAFTGHELRSLQPPMKAEALGLSLAVTAHMGFAALLVIWANLCPPHQFQQQAGNPCS